MLLSVIDDEGQRSDIRRNADVGITTAMPTLGLCRLGE
jgi:hypothetical protein